MPFDGKPEQFITAENFAKWAEEQPRIKPATVGTIGENCAVAQFLRATGFDHGWMGMTDWRLAYKARLTTAPRWAQRVARAYDSHIRSGPALAKIARENA